MRKLEIILSIERVGVRYTMLFTDFYDLADHIKQFNLKGDSVVVHQWNYVGERQE